MEHRAESRADRRVKGGRVQLEQVVPWGRSFDEYRRMFMLLDDDLERAILGCGDGPAAFNSHATLRGSRVVSCDPIYTFTAKEINRRIAEVYPELLQKTRDHADDFVWKAIHTPEELGAVRMHAMRAFLHDFPHGKREGRYIAAELPTLPFEDGAFGLALCSHYLFLYSSVVDEDAHTAAMREMLRVAGEVRVFPLLTLEGVISPHLQPVMGSLVKAGHEVTILKVPYEFQRGGNQMLRVRRIS